MPKNDSVFSEEYQTGTETTAKPQSDKPEIRAVEVVYESEIETEKYMSGKPRRIIVRGRIFHDQG